MRASFFASRAASLGSPCFNSISISARVELRIHVPVRLSVRGKAELGYALLEGALDSPMFGEPS
jgi:hypothetical protein